MRRRPRTWYSYEGERAFKALNYDMEIDQSVNAHVGRRIALLREQKGLSRMGLAALLSVSEDHIRRYERGTNGVAPELLTDISNKLDVPLRYFLDGMPTAEVIHLVERR